MKTNDLIDRQAAIDMLAEMQGRCTSKAALIQNSKIWQQIKDLPTAQPEIIHCRECRYYEWMSNRVPEEQTWLCHNWNAETGKDDFCSYAERREE